jgi:pimeloyl-ACP methyl ester carboxylesterase
LRSLSGGGFRHTPRLGAGKPDQDVPVANARLLHKRIHGSTIHIYGDAGHAFLIQHAKPFASAVRQFLR